MRRRTLAAVTAFASLAACAPPMNTYDYPAYGFTVDFPAAPKLKDTTDPQTGARITVVESRSLGRDFAVTITKVDPARDLDAEVDDASQAMAKTIGGEVTYRTYSATAEGVLGREQVFTKDGRRAMRARYYRSGDRFYILTAQSVMGFNPGADSTPVDPSTESGTDNDPGVTKVLTSFHVTPTAKR